MSRRAAGVYRGAKPLTEYPESFPGSQFLEPKGFQEFPPPKGPTPSQELCLGEQALTHSDNA